MDKTLYIQREQYEYIFCISSSLSLSFSPSLRRIFTLSVLISWCLFLFRSVVCSYYHFASRRPRSHSRSSLSLSLGYASLLLPTLVFNSLHVPEEEEAQIITQPPVVSLVISLTFLCLIVVVILAARASPLSQRAFLSLRIRETFRQAHFD